MPKRIQKSLKDYLSKIKKQTPHLQFSHSSLSSTTGKIIAGCKHPKSLSFTKDRSARKNHHDHRHHHHQNDEAAATLEDIDKFLVENFKSLYGEDHRSSIHKDADYVFTHNKFNNQKEKAEEYQLGQKGDITTLGGVGILFDSPNFFTPPPDLRGSHRFFVSPVSSSSLIEGAQLSGMGTPSYQETGSTSTSTGDTRSRPHNFIKDDTSTIPRGIEDCIALLRVSPSPYEEFRRSMQEILDAKINNNQRIDWDFMEELLFCYLRLNEKKQYRYILSAFVDLVVVLRQNSNNRGPEGHGVKMENRTQKIE